ncbi:MAG: DUF456 domain-containing protein [Bacillota bacterium]|nr:DUF456 domain-containing protein [Bacillota bacterium]
MAAIGMILAILLFILGLAGTVLPVLPGAPLIWLGMLIYGLFTRFADLSVGFYVWQGVAVAVTLLIDYAATAYGTKRYGGSSAAVYGSIAGLLIGPFILGPIGIVIGPFAGAFIGELVQARRGAEAAFRAAFGTLIGVVGGTLLKLAVEIGMIVGFLWVVLS